MRIEQQGYESGLYSRPDCGIFIYLSSEEIAVLIMFYGKEALDELGILEVIQPEEDSALLVASMLHINGAIKVLGLNRKNAVAEIMIPEKYVGHSLESINMETRFQLKVIALKIYPTGSRIASFLKTDCKVEFEIDLARPLRATDVLVIGGETNDIIKFIES